MFTKADLHRPFVRCSERFCHVMTHCPDVGLTMFMCEEISKISNHFANTSNAKYKARMKGHEYLTVVMILPFVLCDLVAPELDRLQCLTKGKNILHTSCRTMLRSDPFDDIIPTLYKYVEYICALRVMECSQSEVDNLVHMAVDVQRAIKDTFPKKTPQDKRGWNILKFHWLLTFPVSIILMGCQNGTSTQPIELAHQVYSKVIHLISNGKGQITMQVMAKMAEEQALSNMARTLVLDDSDDVSILGGASLLCDEGKTFQYSTNQLYGCPIRLLYADPHNVVRELSSEVRKHVRITDFAGPQSVFALQNPAYQYFMPALLEYIWMRYGEDLFFPDDLRLDEVRLQFVASCTSCCLRSWTHWCNFDGS